jgi:sporulation protein YlmC with PRC-barrel domain
MSAGPIFEGTAMVRAGQARRLIDMVVVDASGDWVGTVSDVYLDAATGEPTWITVRLSWFGPGLFVPLLGVDVTGVRIRVPYATATISAAPRHDTPAPLTPAEQEALFTHYRLSTAREVRPGADSAARSYGRQAAWPRLHRYVEPERESGSAPDQRCQTEGESMTEAQPDAPAAAEGSADLNIAVVLHAGRADGAESMTVERIPLSCDTVAGHERPPAGVSQDGEDPGQLDTRVRSTQ